MNLLLNFLIYIYSRLLLIYPGRFRTEFANEMSVVFEEAIMEAAHEGISSLLIVSIRELGGLMTGIFREIWSERDRSLQFGAHLPGGSIRNCQLGALFLPFVVILLVTVGKGTFDPKIQWLLSAFSLLFLGLLVLVWIVGLIHSFPVWTLPAMGIVLFLVVAFLHITTQILIHPVVEAVLERVWGGTGHTSLARDLFRAVFSQFIFLIIAMAVVTGLLRLVPEFHRQVVQEWTLLSFLLYGIAVVPVVTNDESAGIGLYQTVSLLVLTAGMVIYLRVSKRWQRVLALVIPAVLSPILISLGLYQTFPMQPWAEPMNLSFRISEALQPVLYLAPLPILLIMARLAPRLPLSREKKMA
jgi:hypothetical protein